MADLTRKTANLYNKNGTNTNNGYIANSYLDYNGNPSASSNHTVSEYIDISEFEQITISGLSTASASVTDVFYNANKEKVSTFYMDVVPKTITIPSNAKYIRLTVGNSRKDTLMLNSGSTALPYEPYGWVHSLRKMSTATETIQSGDTIYADGTAISTYTIKGNTVQSGTPTPSNPVPVVGVGELETIGDHTGEYKIPISTLQGSAVNYLGSVQTERKIKKIVLTGQESPYTYTYDGTSGVALKDVLDTNYNHTDGLCTHYPVARSNVANTLWIGASNANLYFVGILDVMGYTTYNQFMQYLADQYAAGTPVTVWYLLATPTTGIVNEPLMKIGTYYDSISNAVAIPTADGANSITVDTIVQPSEFTATWTGWHNAYIKEKSENLFDYSDIESGSINTTGEDVDNPNQQRTHNYISVSPNTTYILSNINDALRMHEYSNSEYIGSSVVSSSFTTSANCTKIRFNGTSGNFLQNTMLNEGSTALPYEPYWK